MALSFEIVDYNEYALLQNDITREIQPEVYEEGLYPVGIFSSFIKFPSTWQTIEFSPAEDANDIAIHTRTEDGLALTIDISFQYQLNKTHLLDMYGQYGIEYEEYFAKVARGVLRDVASEYDALEFFYNRTTITSAMLDALITKEDAFFIEIGEFQLRDVDLPDTFEAAIEAVEVAKQEIKIAEYEQQAAVIRANTLILEAQANANVTLINAQATAQALNITITAEGLALFNLANATGFNTTELLIYLWIHALENLESPYLIIGTDTPLLFDIT